MTSSCLSDADIEAYKKDGYILWKKPVLPEDSFRALQEYADRAFAEAPLKANGQIPQLIDCPHWADNAMFDWLFHDHILNLVEPLTGPDIGLFACHFLRKPPGTGKRVPWHEDSAYWKDLIKPMEVVSINIALQSWTRENGCLQVIPGSHVNGYSEYEDVDAASNVFLKEITEDQFDSSRAVAFELEANEASIHDARIIHSSDPNHSQTTRDALGIRFIPTTSKVDFPGEDFHIYLVRGVDHCGNVYSDPSTSHEIRSTY